MWLIPLFEDAQQRLTAHCPRWLSTDLLLLLWGPGDSGYLAALKTAQLNASYSLTANNS